MSRALSARCLIVSLVALTCSALLTTPGLAAAAATPTVSVPGVVQTAALGRRNTSIRFLDFDHTRAFMSKTTIKGQLATYVNGRPRAVRRVRVKLYRKLDGASSWRHVRNSATGRGGYARFLFRANTRANATYRVVFGGNANLQPSNGTTRVLAHRNIPAQLENGTGRFHGRVSPNWAHRRIFLEKRPCASCGWHRARRSQTGDRGRFRFSVPAPHQGRWWWRASAPSTTSFIWSYSGVYTTTLR
ncbi:MAG: hypothetical protein ABJA81_00790 [Nocardioidaceae bacterium]